MMINQNLLTYLNRRLKEATVILPFRILLVNHMNNGINARMTKTEIETEFNQVHQNYFIATFRRDYVLRQSGNDANAIDQDDNFFYIKPTFLEGMVTEDYQNVLNMIDNHWTTVRETQGQIINEINDLIENGNTEEQIDFISSLLTTRETAKRGQAFEVSSYSVLYTFLYSLGFNLNRFSNTYANDGGMDFIAQEGIYQVTTKLSAKKFDEDIQKLHDVERILVYKDTVSTFNHESFNHHLIRNHLDKKELKLILRYLARKNPSRFIPMILRKINEEFHRELYQN